MEGRPTFTINKKSENFKRHQEYGHQMFVAKRKDVEGIFLPQSKKMKIESTPSGNSLCSSSEKVTDLTCKLSESVNELSALSASDKSNNVKNDVNNYNEFYDNNLKGKLYKENNEIKKDIKKISKNVHLREVCQNPFQSEDIECIDELINEFVSTDNKIKGNELKNINEFLAKQASEIQDNYLSDYVKILNETTPQDIGSNSNRTCKLGEDMNNENLSNEIFTNVICEDNSLKMNSNKDNRISFVCESLAGNDYDFLNADYKFEKLNTYPNNKIVYRKNENKSLTVDKNIESILSHSTDVFNKSSDKEDVRTEAKLTLDSIPNCGITPIENHGAMKETERELCEFDNEVKNNFALICDERKDDLENKRSNFVELRRATFESDSIPEFRSDEFENDFSNLNTDYVTRNSNFGEVVKKVCTHEYEREDFTNESLSEIVDNSENGRKSSIQDIAFKNSSNENDLETIPIKQSYPEASIFLNKGEDKRDHNLINEDETIDTNFSKPTEKPRINNVKSDDTNIMEDTVTLMKSEYNGRESGCDSICIEKGEMEYGTDDVILEGAIDEINNPHDFTHKDVPDSPINNFNESLKCVEVYRSCDKLENSSQSVESEYFYNLDQNKVCAGNNDLLSKNVNNNSITVEENIKNLKRNCRICCTAFYSDHEWLEHMSSMDHSKALKAFKKSHGVDPFRDEMRNHDPKYSYLPPNVKLGNKVQRIGVRPERLDPIPYVPANLFNRRIVVFGESCNMTYKQNNVSRRCRCHTSRSNSVITDSDSNLPIIFVPYQVRVFPTSNSEPKIVQMYLPYIDTKTSDSIIKESLLFPKDKYLGSCINPIDYGLNIRVNNSLKPMQEVKVSSTLSNHNLFSENGFDPQYIPQNHNNNEKLHSTFPYSNSLAEKNSEELFMEKLGLLSVKRIDDMILNSSICNNSVKNIICNDSKSNIFTHDNESASEMNNSFSVPKLWPHESSLEPSSFYQVSDMSLKISKNGGVSKRKGNSEKLNFKSQAKSRQISVKKKNIDCMNSSPKLKKPKSKKKVEKTNVGLSKNRVNGILYVKNQSSSANLQKFVKVSNNIYKFSHSNVHKKKKPTPSLKQIQNNKNNNKFLSKKSFKDAHKSLLSLKKSKFTSSKPRKEDITLIKDKNENLTSKNLKLKENRSKARAINKSSSHLTQKVLPNSGLASNKSLGKVKTNALEKNEKGKVKMKEAIVSLSPLKFNNSCTISVDSNRDIYNNSKLKKSETSAICELFINDISSTQSEPVVDSLHRQLSRDVESIFELGDIEDADDTYGKLLEGFL